MARRRTPSLAQQQADKSIGAGALRILTTLQERYPTDPSLHTSVRMLTDWVNAAPVLPRRRRTSQVAPQERFDAQAEAIGASM